MIRSMTGYARKEAGEAGTTGFTVEIRSLNNRYLDIQVKIPRSFASLESRVKRVVQEHVSRGRLEVFITKKSDGEHTENLSIQELVAEQYVRLLKDMKQRFGLSGEVDLSLIAGLPGVVVNEEKEEDADTAWHILSQGLLKALDDLNRMRAGEADALVRDIKARLRIIETTILTIRTQSPITIENARQRMSEILEKLMQEQADPVRLAQEIAILAERTDVTEELTRLESHLVQFQKLLEPPAHDQIGKKLDFLLQEMFREINTVGSKAMDAKISLDVVTVKAELEKIREQVQNIE